MTDDEKLGTVSFSVKSVEEHQVIILEVETSFWDLYFKLRAFEFLVEHPTLDMEEPDWSHLVKEGFVEGDCSLGPALVFKPTLTDLGISLLTRLKQQAQKLMGEADGEISEQERAAVSSS